jgi:enoyl-CoA hydratase
MMTREDRGDVAVLQLSHGKANALDLELLQTLVTEIEDLSAEARALVLTGSGQMFSAGLDLHTLVEAGPGYTFELLDALNELLERFIELSIPSVAAINGHAIAGGFILAAACDVRLMATGSGKLGLTELLVGVPFPPLVLEVVRAAVGDRCARRMVLHGELFSVADAEDLGLVDELADPASLLDRAVEIANRLGSVPGPAFALSKQQLMAPILMRLEYLGDRHEQLARQVWVAPETVQLMQRFTRERLG